jgi:hypothetical protein
MSFLQWVWRGLGRAMWQFKSFGSLWKHAQFGPESSGIVVCLTVGTVPDILAMVWPSFRNNFGSKSKIFGRILKSFRGSFSSAELALSARVLIGSSIGL